MRICNCEYCKNVKFSFVLANNEETLITVAGMAYIEHKFLRHRRDYFNLKTRRWRLLNNAKEI